jgi:hypothetical protein
MPHVTFCAPPRDEVPLVFAGRGSVEWSSSGLLIRGPVMSKSIDFVTGCFGLVLGFAAAVGVFIKLNLNPESSGELALPLILFGLAGGVWLGRKLIHFGAKTLRLKWDRVSGLHVEGCCVSMFIRRPKGRVSFVLGSHSPERLAPEAFHALVGVSNQMVHEICTFAAQSGVDPRVDLGLRPTRDYTRSIL